MTASTQVRDFTTADPCPDYCNLELGHPADSIHHDGRRSRTHGGPTSEFGPHLSGGSYEFTDQPNVFHHSVGLYTEGVVEFETDAELGEFAGNLADAITWLNRVLAQ